MCLFLAELAICGRMMDLTLNLPFTEFLPERQQIGVNVEVKLSDQCLLYPNKSIQIYILFAFYKVDQAIAKLYIPECNTSRRNFVNLAYNYEKACSDNARSSVSDDFPFG